MTENWNELKNKVVLITGAGKGSGRALAVAFSARGARLAVNDITPVNLDQTEADIRNAGGEVKAYVMDVTKKMPIQSLINRVLDDFGRLDILIHCAEVKPLASVLVMDDWDWQRTLEVNLTSAFLLMQSAGRVMKSQAGGVIMLVAPHLQTDPRQVAYAVSKAGLFELCLQAEPEFDPLNIHIRILDPGQGRSLVEQAFTHLEALAAK